MLEIKKYWGSVTHFTPLRVPVEQLALYGRVQIWQNQAKGLGLRVIPTLVVIAYIDNIYTVGKVISSSKKGSPELFIFQKFHSHHKGVFQSTATIEDQGSLTYCSWLFTRKSHPQVEPLLASYCNKCSYSMIDSWKCQICHIFMLQGSIFPRSSTLKNYTIFEEFYR